MLLKTLGVLALLTALAGSTNAAELCDKYKYGSPEWWNCVTQDRETGS